MTNCLVKRTPLAAKFGHCSHALSMWLAVSGCSYKIYGKITSVHCLQASRALAISRVLCQHRRLLVLCIVVSLLDEPRVAKSNFTSVDANPLVYSESVPAYSQRLAYRTVASCRSIDSVLDYRVNLLKYAWYLFIIVPKECSVLFCLTDECTTHHKRNPATLQSAVASRETIWLCLCSTL